ncbi:MAG: hypothetical protein P9L92_09020 [Candidatus Electryonea clarkiae]|nr:hypothetical protein [Candidatus Electryonea clarkiae]MDP8288699.1 hypothetical protein [Candidatus Electryonea clarkiae]
MEQKKDNLLELIPAYRRGELTPARAHEVAKALADDTEFALESEREKIIVDTLSEIKESPPPRKLLARAVMQAAGENPPKHWLSIETLLIAIGVGVACAAVAQLLTSRINLPLASELLLSVAELAAGNALGFYVCIIMGIVIFLGVGAWLAVRSIR